MFLEKIEKNGLRHDGRIIKVFGNATDPRLTAPKPEMTVVEVDGSPLIGQTFTYPNRGEYTGEQLESDLAEYNLQALGNGIVRALFRFAEQGFRQVAMAAKNPDGSWLVDHPFGDIDGLNMASRFPQRVPTIHLDIFHPDSLPVLKEIVNFDNPHAVMDMMEATRWRRDIATHD